MQSRRMPLYIKISYMFIGLLLSFAMINLGHQFFQTKRIMSDEARLRFDMAGKLTLKELDNLYQPAALSANLLSQQSLVQANTLEQRLESLPFLVALLKAQPSVSSVYMGYENGGFFMLTRSEDLISMSNDSPSAGAKWVVQSIQVLDGKPVGEYLYFAEDLSILARIARSDYRYDPRTRPWYLGARNRKELFVTEPYLFFTSKEVGVSFSRAASNDAAVAGVDIVLRSLDKLLSSSKISPSSRLAITNEKEEVISSDSGVKVKSLGGDLFRLGKLEELNLPMIQELISMASINNRDHLNFNLGDEEWQGVRVGLPISSKKLFSLWMAAPYRELMADAITARNQGLGISLIFLLLGMILAVIMSRAASGPLKLLTDEATKIEQFDFQDPINIDSNITEIIELSHAMGSMKLTIQHFLELSRLLSSETDFQSSLARLLREMQEITSAKGGMIYLVDSDVRTLRLARASWGGQLLENYSQDPIVLLDNPGHPLSRALDEEQVKPRILSMQELEHNFDFLRDIQTPLTLWVLPLKGRHGLVLGALTLLVDEEERPLSLSLMAFVEALSATAAIALNTQRLIDEQKVLLESFIQLIAGAIDSKSPYTGGHCQRVPELTKMLALAACDEIKGPFMNFSLSDEQWEELHIASWLHDCGKVTTPEYIVDKATKLETLYDRIHEVRMRFEVLKRDAEINYWKGLVDGCEPETLQKELAEMLFKLDDDFSFIAQCNIGGEFMSADYIERIQVISRYTWRRTLSDRIGISREELARKALTIEAVLPTIEFVLADKPDHLFARSSREKLDDDNPYGFQVQPPNFLYNRGELYNLCIRRGTLTEEERYKINEHIIQTIQMLEKLPFPHHLQKVPEIAGGHHEKMDGNGYPKRLTRDQMSVPARMIGVADIFEALTANDRPYKKGKKLSEAIEIMADMKKNRHIDPDIFDLFLRSGVYLKYSLRYMSKDMIDDIDVQSYLDSPY